MINNATEEFGFAPRDVYRGIYSFHSTKAQHDEVLEQVDYPKLMSLSKAFHTNCELDRYSDHATAVSPSKFVASLDCWAIDFKSIWIAKEVVLSMRLLGGERIRDMYDLHNVPQNSGVAGRIFEAIAHRVLSGKDVPQSTPMVFSDGIPPTFSTTDTQPPPTSPHDSARLL